MEIHFGARVLFWEWVSADLKVLPHKLVTCSQVLEHSLDFLNKLVTALSFQLDNHHLLGVVARWLLQKKSPAKASLIELFENILGFDNSKEDQDLINYLY